MRVCGFQMCFTRQGQISDARCSCEQLLPRQKGLQTPGDTVNWVAVKELKFSYHNGYMFRYMVT